MPGVSAVLMETILKGVAAEKVRSRGEVETGEKELFSGSGGTTA